MIPDVPCINDEKHEIEMVEGEVTNYAPTPGVQQAGWRCRRCQRFFLWDCPPGKDAAVRVGNVIPSWERWK